MNMCAITIMQVPRGEPFRHPGGVDLYVRVNGRDHINWGNIGPNNCVCFNLSNGSLYGYSLSKIVIPQRAVVMNRGDLRDFAEPRLWASESCLASSQGVGQGLDTYGDLNWPWPNRRPLISQALMDGLSMVQAAAESLTVGLDAIKKGLERRQE